MLTPSRLAIAFVVLAAACGRSDAPAPTAGAPATPPPVSAPAPSSEFRVAAIDLGSALSPDKKIAAPSTSFAPTDTIYASVATEGAAPKVELAARWTYETGQLVSTSSQTLAPTGAANTEFHIAKPSGWPAGRYRVEITANGQPAGAREFEVK